LLLAKVRDSCHHWCRGCIADPLTAAEYVKVPYANTNLYPIPKSADGTWNTSLEIDYVMASNVFATG